MIYHKLLWVLACLLPLFLTAQSTQTDTVTFPTRELSFYYSGGITSKTRFTAAEGPMIFREKNNSALNAGLRVSWYASSNLRLETGLAMGFYDFEFYYFMKQSEFAGDPLVKDGDYDSYSIVWYDRDHDDMYSIDLPFRISGKLWEKRNRHELWASAGVDLNYFIPIDLSSSATVQLDSFTEYPIYHSVYHVNQHRKILPAYNLSLTYSYILRNHHKINLGMVYQNRPSAVVNGSYLSLPYSPNYRGNGRVSSHLNYLGLELSYSINNQRRNELKRAARKNYGSDKPSQTRLPDKWELRIPLEMIHYKSIDIAQKQGEIRPVYASEQDLNLRFNPVFLWYVSPCKALYTGLGYNILVYQTPVRYGPGNVFWPQWNLELPVQFASEFAKLPLGIMFSKPYAEKYTLEAGMDVSMNVSLLEQAVGFSQYGVVDKRTDTTIWLFMGNQTHYNRVFPALSASVGFSRNLKNHNKISVHLSGFYALIPQSRNTYILLQSDGTPTTGKITIAPRFFNMSLSYSFTGKKRRWLRGKA